MNIPVLPYMLDLAPRRLLKFETSGDADSRAALNRERTSSLGKHRVCN